MNKNFIYQSLTFLIIVLLGLGVYSSCGRFNTKLPISETEEVTLRCVTIGGLPFFCGVHKETFIEVPVEIVVKEIVEVAVGKEKTVTFDIEKIVEEIQTEFTDSEVDVATIVDEVLERLPEGSINETPRSEVVKHVENIIGEPLSTQDNEEPDIQLNEVPDNFNPVINLQVIDPEDSQDNEPLISQKQISQQPNLIDGEFWVVVERDHTGEVAYIISDRHYSDCYHQAPGGQITLDGQTYTKGHHPSHNTTTHYMKCRFLNIYTKIDGGAMVVKDEGPMHPDGWVKSAVKYGTHAEALEAFNEL